MTKFSPATAALILERDGGRCFWCGRYVLHGTRGRDYSIHHRCPRGAGGSKAPWIGTAANGLTLCGTGTEGCHGEFESDRNRARALGVLVSALAAFSRVENRPENVPVEDRHGRLWQLTIDGRKLPATPTPL